MPRDLNELATTYDCFYMENNVVQNADLSLLLSLDPLLSSDPMFDPNDMVANVLQQVRSNDLTWALPIAIQPRVMRYNTDLFTQAGAYPPSNGTWTSSQFEDALRMLKTYLGADETPYELSSFDNSSLLMLIAAYGGLPIDYRTDPATINFTDSTTVAAIQQVLGLAKAGYIGYGSLSGTGEFVVMRIGEEETTALYDETLTGNGGMFFSVGGGGGMAVSGAVVIGGPGGQPPSDAGAAMQSTGLTTFPTGSLYSPVAFDLSAAYISANTQYPDACYRFISEISQNPDLITAMPARRSIINSEAILTAQGEGNVAFYNALDQLLQQPDTVIFPSLQMSGGRGGIGNMMSSYWLNRAFDRYVLEDADLVTELTEAETFTRAYQECVAALPPFDPMASDQGGYFQQVQDCITQTDPTASLGR